MVHRRIHSGKTFIKILKGMKLGHTGGGERLTRSLAGHGK